MEKSRIFLSWSGERSKQVATILGDWLQDVLQNVDPFMSDTDIAVGDIWFDQIGNNLDISRFAIICVTPENLDSKWLHFEAGAIGMSRTDGASGAVVPYLLDLRLGDLAPPLSLFQGAIADKQGTLRLLHALNNVLPVRLDTERLERTFERWWPDLETGLAAIPAPATKASESTRSERDILEELLGLVRQGSVPTRTDRPRSQHPIPTDLRRGIAQAATRLGGTGLFEYVPTANDLVTILFPLPDGVSVEEVQEALDEIETHEQMRFRYKPA